MQPQVRMFFAGVGHHGGVGHNHRVRAQIGSGVDGAPPAFHLPGLRVGVDGHQHLPPAVVGVAYAFDDGFLVEIQAGEIARVGRVFQPHVNRVRAVVHGGFQGGQVAGGADEFGDVFHAAVPLRFRRFAN